MNTVEKLINIFDSKSNEINLDLEIINKAKFPIERMVNFNEKQIINKAS